MKIQVQLTRKGKAWVKKENNKLEGDEELEDCVLLDLMWILQKYFIGVDKNASVSSITKEIRKAYRVEYGDDCSPKSTHVAHAFKHGYIRFVLVNR